MRWEYGWWLLVVLGCNGGSESASDRPDGAQVNSRFGALDSDGDFISDLDEGREFATDTDGDGVSDYLDPDSDGDGIRDRDEVSDRDLATPARDSDQDGVPDFRDSDSDENGIPDSIESTADTDFDGLADYFDLDDDNDFLSDAAELNGQIAPLRDRDSDGIPDYHDPDSDNDFLLDGDESIGDLDVDGLVNFIDDDSDGDGIVDRLEAGDNDVFSRPRDTDGDRIPDFLDIDSDGDGLSDAAEVEANTNPYSADSDGDLAEDLIEVGAGTDPLDPTSNPAADGNFVFLSPYELAPSPSVDTLRMRTNFQQADVLFLFDNSGSMANVIGALQSNVVSMIDSLTCDDTGIPCISDQNCPATNVCSAFGSCIESPLETNCVTSVFTGSGHYSEELRVDSIIQSDPRTTQIAVGDILIGSGTERLLRALWCAGDPERCPGAPEGCSEVSPGRIGCPAFREDAKRILVYFTDEDSDGDELASDVGDALIDADITTIGVWSGPALSLHQDLIDVALASNSISPQTGQPYVFSSNAGTVVHTVLEAINEIVDSSVLRIGVELIDDDGSDEIDPTSLVEYLEVNTGGGSCSAFSPLLDADSDGHNDTFPAVRAGTLVCWDLIPAVNTTVRPTEEPQLVRARVNVLGDGEILLDSRVIFFLIPPEIVQPSVD
ncbi:MAG: hypothetical protein AAF355_04880 [Myxococcota bacterium]